MLDARDLWLGGFRIYSPEAIQAENYMMHVLPANFTCAASDVAWVPKAQDFDLDAVLKGRGEDGSAPLSTLVKEIDTRMMLSRLVGVFRNSNRGARSLVKTRMGRSENSCNHLKASSSI